MGTLVASNIFLRRAHDDDGAPGVVDTLLTHRAEQQASEPAMPARPNHQEVARCGGVKKDRGGSTLDDLPLDLDVPRFPDGLADRRLERLFSRSSKITGVGTGRIERTDETEVAIAPCSRARVAVRPGMNHSQWDLAETRLRQRPARRS